MSSRYPGSFSQLMQASKVNSLEKRINELEKQLAKERQKHVDDALDSSDQIKELQKQLAESIHKL